MEATPVGQLLFYFPDKFKKQLAQIREDGLEEIHVRVHQPIQLVTHGKDRLLYPENGADLPTPQDLQDLTARLCGQSLYAHMEELSRGFLSLPGGYRVGVAGRYVHQQKGETAITEVSSVNIRIPRSVPGQVEEILPFLYRDGRLSSTLILSPPACGKTTFLRELIRLVSTGNVHGSGQRVGVADTRFELAGMAGGIPAFDLGPRTDVRSGGEKGEALLALLLAMSPEVLATDEIGRPEEAEAAISASLSGVVFLATAHGDSLSDLACRPDIRRLILQGLFERFVILSRRQGPGTIEAVLDSNGKKLYDGEGV